MRSSVYESPSDSPNTKNTAAASATQAARRGIERRPSGKSIATPRQRSPEPEYDRSRPKARIASAQTRLARLSSHSMASAMTTEKIDGSRRKKPLDLIHAPVQY